MLVGDGVPFFNAPDFADDLGLLEMSACMWVSTTVVYLRLVGEGVAVAGLRYEDLLSDPERTVRALFEHWGAPLDDKSLTAAVEAMAHDSQAGTGFDREARRVEKTEAEIKAEGEKISAIVRLAGLEPDQVLAGTL